jgi:predicted AAA+ superfamily ATPase
MALGMIFSELHVLIFTSQRKMSEHEHNTHLAGKMRILKVYNLLTTRLYLSSLTVAAMLVLGPKT